MYDISEINNTIRSQSIEVAEEILYRCIDRLNLIDVYSYCQKHNCKRDNIYKKIKKGDIPSIVIERKFYIVQSK